MMERRPNREFGKRGPIASQPAVPTKRSGHVALLLMSTVAVGGGAYALMPRGNCEPSSPGMAAPAVSQQASGCGPRSSSSGGGHGGYWSSRSSYFSSDTGSSYASSGPSDSGSGGVTRGGFGSFARAFSAHFSVGG
ncbi:MAG TPA: hypothetical protein VGM09_05525 [Bradyrhizobium sp.]|jgi:hypothetical protein